MRSRIDRRAFLKCGAGLAASSVVLPHFIPGASLGKDRTVARSERIGIGCIGVGGMGTGNMQVFLGLPECRVAAVCDTYESRRQKAKELVDNQYGNKGCAMYGDYREIIGRKDIDAMMIAVQDHWHALIATAAAQAGKDMYCEKPLGVSVEEGKAMRDAVRRYGRVFQTGTQQRSERNFRFACELAINGYVGRI